MFFALLFRRTSAQIQCLCPPHQCLCRGSGLRAWSWQCFCRSQGFDRQRCTLLVLLVSEALGRLKGVNLQTGASAEPHHIGTAPHSLAQAMLPQEELPKENNGGDPI